MHVLVTGAAGFIGFHLCQRLLSDGYTVTGIDSLNEYYSLSLKLDRLKQLQDKANFTFFHINLSDTLALQQIFAQHTFSHVVNLAAQAGVRYSIENPGSYIQSNLVGFGNLLECCRHGAVQHLVFASSSSVYGLNTLQPYSVHHNVDHPISLYAASKKSNELMAHAYSHLYQLPATGLRFFTVYGPWGRPDMALFLFTKAILSGEPIQVFNNGKMQRDFTYIDDIIEGVVKILMHIPGSDPLWDGRKPNPSSSIAPWKIYNIGNNNPVELDIFIETLESILGKKAIKQFLPMQPGDVQSTWADIDELTCNIDFSPTTSIGYGIGRFVDWYKSYYLS